jgi:hypothetical protein
MRKTVRRRHDAHVRGESVCAEHSALFDATPGGQKARAVLGTDVAEVVRLLALQERSIEDRRAATEQCRQSRRKLRDAAKAVVPVGRMVDVGDPVMDTMKLPGDVTDDELLAYSRALLERVSAHADVFVAEGLPPNLLKNLGNGIEGFAAAREAQAGSRQRFSAAFESIRETLDHADKAVDALEAIAINTPDAFPEVVTKLRMARRVGPRVSPPEPKPPQAAPTAKAA